MNEYKYRIRVEKRPNEDFKRFYPEAKKFIGKTVYSKWENTQMPVEVKWYKNEEECEKHLDRLCEWDRKFNDDYTITTIKYPKVK